MNSSSFYRKFFHFFLLLVLVFVCYSNTLDAPWHFDDTPNIVENENIKIQDLSWGEIKKTLHFSLYEDAGAHTRPISSFTFALNYLYSGNDTTSYHVVNICIHLIVSWLVYLVFLLTIKLYKTRVWNTSPDAVSAFGDEIALLGAVLWSIHPIHTQAVTYIVQRHALLSAMFYILAMYCYIKARLDKKNIASFALILLAVLFYLLGLASKQNAVLLPLALIGYEVAFFRYPFLGALRKSRVWQVVYLAGFIISSLGAWFWGKAVFGYLVTGYISRTFTMWERLITEPIVLWKYIFLLLAPLSNFLALESDIVASRSLLDPPVTIVAVIAIFSLVALGLYLLKRQPLFGYAIIFFFINHVVESTFIGLELYFEHRNYLPSIFIYLALSFLFIHIMYSYMVNNKIFLHVSFVVLIVCYVISDGNATYSRNDVWRNEIVLMDDAISSAPNNLRPYISASAAYMSLGKFDEAKKYLKKAEMIYSNNPDAYPSHVVGLLYYNASALYTANPENKDIDKAVNLLYKSCEIYPFFFKAHVNLGLLLFQKGEYQQAELAFENALATASTTDLSADFYRTHSSILFAQGKLGETIRVLKQGLEIEKSPELHLNLVAAYLKQGDLAQARRILLSVSEHSDNLQYLLCRALLSTSHERDSALTQVSELLVGNNENYCEWLGRLKVNALPGIIFPDITELEGQLAEKYLDAIEHIRNEISLEIAKATKCNFIPEENLTSDLSENDNYNHVRN